MRTVDLRCHIELGRTTIKLALIPHLYNRARSLYAVHLLLTGLSCCTDSQVVQRYSKRAAAGYIKEGLLGFVCLLVCACMYGTGTRMDFDSDWNALHCMPRCHTPFPNACLGTYCNTLMERLLLVRTTGISVRWACTLSAGLVRVDRRLAKSLDLPVCDALARQVDSPDAHCLLCCMGQCCYGCAYRGNADQCCYGTLRVCSCLGSGPGLPIDVVAETGCLGCLLMTCCIVEVIILNLLTGSVVASSTNATLPRPSSTFQSLSISVMTSSASSP